MKNVHVLPFVSQFALMCHDMEQLYVDVTGVDHHHSAADEATLAAMSVRAGKCRAGSCMQQGDVCDRNLCVTGSCM